MAETCEQLQKFAENAASEIFRISRRFRELLIFRAPIRRQIDQIGGLWDVFESSIAAAEDNARLLKDFKNELLRFIEQGKSQGCSFANDSYFAQALAEADQAIGQFEIFIVEGREAIKEGIEKEKATRIEIEEFEKNANKPEEPAPAETTPPATENQEDDDRETQAKSSEGQTEDVGPTSNNPTNASASGTGSGSQVAPGPAGTKGTYIQPGRRLSNPLASFASSTYQLTLYMITPDAYEAFIQSGRKKIAALESATGVTTDSNFSSTNQAGAYIIAQSGGINNSVGQRAPGFELDYYIDDLRIVTATNAKSTLTASNTTNVSFKIIEPYGFSFISNLKRAGSALQEYNKNISYKNLSNAYKQFFILGIRFYGYDINGNLLTGKESLYGDVIDSSGSENGIFEQFYDIALTKITFRLEGVATTYTITAAATAPQTAMGLKRGVVQQRTTLEGTTVKDILLGEKGLFTRLNQLEKDLVEQKKITYANEYDIAWVGDGTYEKIALASIVLNSDLDKTKFKGANTKSTTDSTEALGVAAVPDSKARVITINSGATILQLLSQIIAQSSYLEDALKVIYTSTLEPDPVQNSPKIETGQDISVSWYNVSVELSNPRWDPLVQDWAYKMTYVFQIYDTPIITDAYSVYPEDNYYGPHKRYQYWFGGQNSEIIEYQQNFNNLYFTVALDGLSPKLVGEEGSSPASEQGQVSVAPKMRTGGDTTGKLNIGMEAQNAYVTSLYDPEAYTTAKMRILGDPDFLISESSSSLNTLYNKFYGTNGFTVSANGGQVFVEVDFKEATDYKNSTGLLNINDSIQFFPYPNSLKDKIKGVSYMVINVISNFSGGKFEQDLTLVIPPFYSTIVARENLEGREETTERGSQTPDTTGSSPTDTTSTTGNSGLILDPDLPKILAQPVQVSLEAPSINIADSINADDDGLSEITLQPTQEGRESGLIVAPIDLIDPGPINLAPPIINLGRGRG